jgi:S-formylglutathione hydrolase
LGEAAFHVVVPPSWEASECLPLVLVLHGGNVDSSRLVDSVVHLEALWSEGRMPRAVAACLSTPTVGGFYCDQPGGGQWESVFAEDEFIGHLHDVFNVDLNRVALFGVSMGGYGALKLAFTRPERYRAVAAVEPCIFPTESLAGLRQRNLLTPLLAAVAAMSGGTSSAASFHRNNVVCRLREHADAVRASGLPILLECGDHDYLNLHDGVEYLHRVLWDVDISHEYHLVRGADHLGPSLAGRRNAALVFLGSALSESNNGPDQTILGTLLGRIRNWVDGGRNGPMPAFDVDSPEAVVVMREMTRPSREAIVDEDPTAGRRYGLLTIASEESPAAVE